MFVQQIEYIGYVMKKTLRYCIRLAIATLFSVYATAQRLPPRLGQHVSQLHFSTVYQSPETLPHSGRPLVLEYWATWCVPCVHNIPHLNELASKYAKEVDFLNVTAEDGDVVRPFLKKHPMSGTIARDLSLETNADLIAPGLPVTVLIDSDGRLSAVTRPDYVNTSVIDALLHHTPLPMKTLDVRTIGASLNPSAEITGEGDIVSVSVRQGPGPTLGFLFGDQQAFGSGELRSWLKYAYNAAPSQIALPDDLNATYTVNVRVPGYSRSGLQAVLQGALVAASGLQVKETQASQTVLVLRGFPGRLALPKIQGGNDLLTSDDTHLDTPAVGPPEQQEEQGIHAERLRSTLQSQLNRPVLLEGVRDTRAYLIHLQWKPSDLASLQAAFAAQGITLQETTRTVPVYTFSAEAH